MSTAEQAEPAVKNRATVVEQLYHRAFGDQPVQFESRYSRELKSNEQAYERRLTIGDQWEDFDTGWIRRIGIFAIRNEEGRNLQRIPTKEERGEIDGRIVEIFFVSEGASAPFPEAHLRVYPGETAKGCPAVKMKVRCRSGTARCTVFVVPE